MKIIKHLNEKLENQQLIEKVLVEEDEEAIEINDSVDEIADQIQDDAAEQNKIVSDGEAEAQAQEIKDVANEVEAKQAVNLDLANRSLNTENALTKALDACLAESRTKRRRYKRTDGTVATGSNLLVEGLPGSGKTAIVYDWAKGKGVTLVYVNAKDNDLEAFLNGFTVRDDENRKQVTKAYSNALDILNSKQDCILFLDEFNRQTKENIRASILTLINEKYVQGEDQPETPGRHYFPNLLFSIACINPAVGRTDKGAAKLNQAEMSRFAHALTGKQAFDSNIETANDYFTKHFNREVQLLDKEDEFYNEDLEANLRMQDLGLHIVNHPEFEFDNRDDLDALDDGNKTMLNMRHLTDGLEASATGDIDDFRNWVNNDSNMLDKDIEMLNKILDDYQIPSLNELAKAKAKELNLDLIDIVEEEPVEEPAEEPEQEEDEDDADLFGGNADGKEAVDPNTAQQRINDAIGGWF